MFGTITIVSKKDAGAPIAKQFAKFEKHKQALLNALQRGCKLDRNPEPFDAEKSWDDIARLARLFFWDRTMEQHALPKRERVKRLHQLAKTLREAHGLTQRAMRDNLGDELFRAWFTLKMISIEQIDEIDRDGSSIVTRVTDEIKEMTGSLARLEAISRAAAASANVLSKTGRPTLLPRDCIQGLARIYRTSTGATPGRGSGPFADFAYEFMIAVGQTDFDYRSLTGAIQESHQQIKPSWFDEKM